MISSRLSGPARAGVVGLFTVALAGGGAAMAASATAATYPPALSCDSGAQTSGGVTTVSGTGYQADSPITINPTGDGSTVTTTTNGSGSYSTTLNGSPSSLSISGGGCPISDITPISDAPSQGSGTTVTGTGSGTGTTTTGSSGSLAYTGAEIGGAAGLGALLVVAGGVMVHQGRKRRA